LNEKGSTLPQVVDLVPAIKEVSAVSLLVDVHGQDLRGLGLDGFTIQPLDD